MGLHLRLSHKIVSIGMLGVVGLLALGGLYLIGEASQEVSRKQDDSAQSLRELQNKALVTLLKLRRAEKDFLLRKDEKYIRLHEDMSREVAAEIGELRRRSANSGQNDLDRNLAAIETGYQTYRSHFVAWRRRASSSASARIWASKAACANRSMTSKIRSRISTGRS